MIGNSDNHKHF